MKQSGAIDIVKGESRLAQLQKTVIAAALRATMSVRILLYKGFRDAACKIWYL